MPEPENVDIRTIDLTYKLPPSNMRLNLAPRVQGKGHYIGEYGYALAIFPDGRFQVAWDDGGGVHSSVRADEIVFIRGH